MPEQKLPAPPPGQPVGRRNFVKELLAAVLGFAAALIPAISGLLVVLDPIRRRSSDAGMVKVAPWAALPADGTPQKFPIIASRTDAWSKTPATPIGAVYLRRIAEDRVQAFTVVCPHAGCFVDYLPNSKNYLCPCHNSTFTLDGAVNDPKSPSPRGLDELTAEVRQDGTVWVRFQKFRPGHAHKEPQA